MIFQYTWPQVVIGKKVATRRLIHPSETAIRMKHNKIFAVEHKGRVKWQIGKTYAVQPGRGQKQVARIRLKRITRQKVNRISTREAQAEGFINRQDFLQTWGTIHSPDRLDERVWVLEFELDKTTPALKSLSWPQIDKPLISQLDAEKSPCLSKI